MFNLQVQEQEDPIVHEDGTEGPVPAGPVISLPAPQSAAEPPVAAAPAAAQRPPAAAQRQPARHRQHGPPAASRAGRGDRRSWPARGPCPRSGRPQRSGNLSYSAPSEDASGTARAHDRLGAGSTSYANVGRNAPCPCGSGRKFKQCHGDPRNR